MKITNLFLDFILVATAWFMSVAGLLYVWDPDELAALFANGDATLLPGLVALAYVFGVLLDQVSDRLLDWGTRPLRLHAIPTAKASFVDHDITYHEALQFVVVRSQRAFEYLSYRRSAIRIVRALLAAWIVSLTAGVLLGIITALGWVTLADGASGRLALVIVCSGVGIAFLRSEFITLQRGYFEAIKIFRAILNTPDTPEGNSHAPS